MPNLPNSWTRKRGNCTIRPVRIVRRGTERGRYIGGQESDVAFCRGLPSGTPGQISIEFHRTVEMMEANDMLLWTVLRGRVRVSPQIEKLHPQVEEFHLTTAELDAAKRGRGRVELAQATFRTVVNRHL